MTDSIHPDLQTTKDQVYDPNGFKFSSFLKEVESTEYGASSFKLNDLSIRFRVAKVTPTKIGQFVTFWKRIGRGPIQPYDRSDTFDFLVISTRKNHHFGQFVFSKAILCEQGIISINGKGGKRALRVYPPWDQSISHQAQKTQTWQLNYFLKIPLHKSPDFSRIQSLYKMGSF